MSNNPSILHNIAQADFTGITQANALPIIFTGGSTQTTIEISINNDNLVERTEWFLGQIISGGGISDLRIFAPTATVDITDNDGKYIPYGDSYGSNRNIIFSLSLSLSLSLPPYSLFYSIVLVFGFEEPSYTFSESVGNGLLGVHVREDSGQVSENVVFTFSTGDGSAVGESLIPCSVPYCPCTSPCACTIVTYIEYSPSCVHYSS